MARRHAAFRRDANDNELGECSARRQRRRLLGIVSDYESIHEVVTRANRWIERERVEVLNVETLLVTAIPSEEGDLRPKMDSPGAAMYTYQVVRVWYRVDSSHLPYTGETRRLAERELPAAGEADDAEPHSGQV